MTEQQAQSYEVIIVGGGMVGASLAAALAQENMRIAVIEPFEAQRRWSADLYENRVSAITRATQRVFEQLGAWEGMVERDVCSYEHMAVWDATGSGEIHFDSADLGEPNLGHIIENRVILAALLDRLEELESCDLFCPAKASELEVSDEGVRLVLEDGRELSAPLIVGAEGNRSWVRQQAGIETTGWSYEQSAVVATIKTAQPHQDTCWQRFMPDGPLAFLPLNEGYSSIVWTTSPQQAEELAALPEDEFLQALHETFGDRLGAMTFTGPRGVFPLALQHADAYVKPRIALIGNAAHAIHPLAGQGLNLGISDVAALAEVLFEARKDKKDIGRQAVLRRYERWRKGDNIGMSASMELFKQLFGSQLPGVGLLRNLGLSLTNAAAPVKNHLIRHAMGLEGDLPRLARGVPLK